MRNSRDTTSPGQFLCVGFPGQRLTTETRRFLRELAPGGVVLFARNIDNDRQLRALTAELKAELPGPPLIAIDQEHGRVNRLRSIVGELPRIADLKRDGDAAAAERFGRQTGEWLRDYAIDLDFAPVLDLELFGPGVENALRERCWGATAEEVIRWAGAFLRGLSAVGGRGCAKHFPGLGGSERDSHDALPTVRRDRETLLATDVRAFAGLLPALSAVMVGHGHYPAFDGETPVPATLSPAIVGGLLRQQLGFAGVVVTDDLEMGAVGAVGGFESAVVRAFNAGADLLLVCHTPAKMIAARDALAAACAAGQVPAARLAGAARQLANFRQAP
jgi:beta-N-acetylhexosaminidase